MRNSLAFVEVEYPLNVPSIHVLSPNTPSSVFKGYSQTNPSLICSPTLVVDRTGKTCLCALSYAAEKYYPLRSPRPTQ